MPVYTFSAHSCWGQSPSYWADSSEKQQKAPAAQTSVQTLGEGWSYGSPAWLFGDFLISHHAEKSQGRPVASVESDQMYRMHTLPG